ncbi:MAG TPA: DUF5941 domain-containing protein [Streptosporangiaceae bacterium]|nr:DUF5941 domain-containing protein [Streptosporangiaceae bacterium]
MTTISRPRPPDPAAYQSGRLLAYRDDGWISQALGRLTHGMLPPLAPALVAAGITAVLILADVGGEAGILVFAPVVALLMTGPTSSHAHDGRLDWLVPPIIRAIEYGYLAALGFAQGVPEPLIYVLIAVLAYHHYDIVYRTRQRLWPPAWLFAAGLGWDGRMLIAAVSAFVGITSFAYAALAAYLGVLFGVESVSAWARTERGEGVMINLEDEEEAGS